MSADVVNLRHVRKAKVRAARSAQAVVNRAKFGRTKAEVLKTASERHLAGNRLDQSKLDQTDPDQVSSNTEPVVPGRL